MMTAAPVLHVPASEGVSRWVSGDVYRMTASQKETGGTLAFGEALVLPGGGPVAHVHPRSDEAFFLIDGHLDFLDGEKTFTASAGDFVFVPRGTRHRFRNLTDVTARMVFCYTPGGPERLFLEGGDLPVAGELPTPWGMERFIALAELAALSGTEVVPEDAPGSSRGAEQH